MTYLRPPKQSGGRFLLHQSMYLSRIANRALDSFLTLVYPQPCLLCGCSVESHSLGVTCRSCWLEAPLFNRDQIVCWKCGVPSSGFVTHELRETVRCRRCDRRPFLAARACGAYEGALRQCVLTLKRQPHLPSYVVKVLAQTFCQAPLNQCTRILPVPLHPERYRTRGFNQAAVIAATLSSRAAIPVDEVSLVRTTHSEKYRAGLDAKGRQQTVESAFEVQFPRLVAGETILLVDDVFTTGATASSCAEVLLAAGAAEVMVLTLARAWR